MYPEDIYSRREKRGGTEKERASHQGDKQNQETMVAKMSLTPKQGG
jgi:hypothetical protein